MRRLALLLACLLALPARATDGIEFNPAPGYTTVQNSGTSLTRRRTLNLTGSGVTCVDDSGGNKTTCTVSGSSGGAQQVAFPVDLSTSPVATADVTGLTSITSAALITCGIYYPPGAPSTYGTLELYNVAIINISAGLIVPGTGFSIRAWSVNGAAAIFNVVCTYTD